MIHSPALGALTAINTVSLIGCSSEINAFFASCSMQCLSVGQVLSLVKGLSH